MIKLRLIQPGQPDVHLEVEGSIATIGRSSECDVVIRQPYVSKHHALILKGVVVVDLGSSNGTYVGKERVHQASLLDGHRIRLGDEDLLIEVEDAVKASSAPELAVQAERLRTRITSLNEKMGRIRTEGAEVEDGVLEELRAENSELRQRMESLEADLDASEEEANALLNTRLVGVEDDVPLAKTAMIRPDEVEPGLPGVVARLEAERREQDKVIDKLREDLERLSRIGSGRSPFGEALAESEDLRRRLTELEKRQERLPR